MAMQGQQNVGARTEGQIPVGKTATQQGMMGSQPTQTEMQGQQQLGQMTGQQQFGQGQGQNQQLGQYGQQYQLDPIEQWFQDPFNVGFGSRRLGPMGQQQLGFRADPFSNALAAFGGLGAGLGGLGTELGFPNVDRLMGQLGSFTPSMKLDISETDAEYNMKMDLPGVSMNDVNLEVDDRTHTLHVSVKNERSTERTEETREGMRIHRSERTSGSGYRAIRLPPNTDLNRVNAKLENGLMCVTVPKTEQVPGRKRISLGGSSGQQAQPQQTRTQGQTRM